MGQSLNRSVLLKLFFSATLLYRYIVKISSRKSIVSIENFFPWLLKEKNSALNFFYQQYEIGYVNKFCLALYLPLVAMHCNSK